MSLFAIICRLQIARMIGFYYFLNRVSALWDFVESLCRKTGLAIKAESTFDLQDIDVFSVFMLLVLSGFVLFLSPSPGLVDCNKLWLYR